MYFSGQPQQRQYASHGGAAGVEPNMDYSGHDPDKLNSIIGRKYSRQVRPLLLVSRARAQCRRRPLRRRTLPARAARTPTGALWSPKATRPPTHLARPDTY